MEILFILFGVIHTQESAEASLSGQRDRHKAVDPLLFQNVVFQMAVFSQFFNIIDFDIASDCKLFHPEGHRFKRKILKDVFLRGYAFRADFIGIVCGIVFYIYLN